MKSRYVLVPLLTPAEETVLAALLAGMTTNRALATHLEIAEPTVRTHLSAIRQKICARNKADVILWAVLSGYDVTGYRPEDDTE